MNYIYACEILEIEPTNVSIEIIKKHYRSKALQYHPDKNTSIDAIDKFREINEAYNYLLDVNNEQTDNNVSYNGIFSEFINYINIDNTLQIILNKICISCENNTLEYLENLKLDKLLEIYSIIKKCQHIFHIQNEYLDKLFDIIQSKKDECIYYTLNPTLNDLLKANIYKLQHNNDTYLVPLWHSQLQYESEQDKKIIYVFCNPILDDNITIDENNNLHISVQFNVSDIWNSNFISIPINDEYIELNINNLSFKSYQKIIYKNKGLPKIIQSNMFQYYQKTMLILHINLKC